MEDINQARGDILIQQGKEHKPRNVYMGKQSKWALRKYLMHRDHNPALWVTHPRNDLDRRSYDDLRGIMHRRSLDANVEVPSLHDFRRAFALAMLRYGTDIFTLLKLMGHEGTSVLQRYLMQSKMDRLSASTSWSSG